MGWTVYNSDGKILQSAELSDNAVTTAKILDDAVTVAKLANSINTDIDANTAKTGITSGQASAITANTAKVTNATHTGDVTGATALTIATGAVDIAHLSASGTKDGTTVLYGNNTFAAVGGGGAVVREGGQLGIGTTVSTSADDILTAADLSIAAAQPIMIHHLSKKGSGASGQPETGISLYYSGGNTDVGRVYHGASTNQEEHSQRCIFIPSRVTGFLRAGPIVLNKSTNTSGASTRASIEAMSVEGGPMTDYPTTAITTIRVEGLTISGILLSVDELNIYSLAIS